MGKLSLDDIKTTLDNSKLDDSKKNSRIGSFPPEEDDYNRSPQEQKLLEDIENLKANRAMRKEYAEKAYDFAKYTIAFWAFLFLAYFLSPPDKKPLSEIALGIFTTACTVNILAAFISIIKGLFPSNKD